MIEVLLIELLRKAGIITGEQAVEVTSAQQLYDLLIKLNVIKPLLAGDRMVLEEVERIMADKVLLSEKIIRLKELQNFVKDESFEKILASLVFKAEDIQSDLSLKG